jgi:hypothetical protein
MTRAAPPTVSADLEQWLRSDGSKTVGDLIDVFEEKSFAILFIVLLGVPALPLPTGGATHVFEVIAVLVAAQLVAGRTRIWLPERLRKRDLGGTGGQGFLTRLIRVIAWLERFSRPRLTFLFGRRVGNTVFGLLVVAGSVAAFVAPPFSALDTLPALGVVLLSLGYLLEDAALSLVGILVGAAGVVVEIVVGGAVLRGIGLT